MDPITPAVPTIIATVAVALLLYIARRVAEIAKLPDRVAMLDREWRAEVKAIRSDLARIQRGITRNY